MPRPALPASASQADRRSPPETPWETGAKKPGYVLPRGVALWIGTKLTAAALFFAGHPWAALPLYLSLDPWFLWQILVPAAAGFGPVATRFRTTRREVWLTIDDGPDPVTTPLVLKLLDEYKVRATFFVIGANVQRHPALALEIARRGHTLANHTQTHPAASFWAAGPRRIGREIDACNSALQAVGLEPACYFRAPVGIKTVFLHPALAARNMDLVAWNSRGYDCVADEAIATRRILQSLKPGAIALLHEGRSELSRVAVLEGVLKGMREAGFTAALPDRASLSA